MHSRRSVSSFILTLATGVAIALWILIGSNCAPLPTCPSPNYGVGYPDTTEQWVY